MPTRLKRGALRAVAVLVALAVVAGGCGASAVSPSPPRPSGAPTAAPSSTAAPTVSPVGTAPQPADPTPLPADVPLPGGSLAVTRTDPMLGTSRIELVAIHGSGSVVLAHGRDPAWMPDGSTLLFACPIPRVEIETFGICAVRLDDAGSGPKFLVAEGDSPSVSPDGTLVAFRRGMIDVGTTWLANVDGSGVRRAGSGAFLRWSPDGQWLVGQPESATFEVAVLSAAGGVATPVSAGYDPAWSPDGSLIAFALVDERGSGLYVATNRMIERRFLAPPGVELSAPAWLPGGALVFVLAGDLWRLETGTAVPVRLTTGLDIRTRAGRPLAVSADGSWIAFATSDADGSRLGVASSVGGWRIVNTGPDPVTQPVWRPALQP
jgi:Tol biopolymer transport system component